MKKFLITTLCLLLALCSLAGCTATENIYYKYDVLSRLSFLKTFADEPLREELDTYLNSVTKEVLNAKESEQDALLQTHYDEMLSLSKTYFSSLMQSPEGTAQEALLSLVRTADYFGNLKAAQQCYTAITALTEAQRQIFLEQTADIQFSLAPTAQRSEIDAVRTFVRELAQNDAAATENYRKAMAALQTTATHSAAYEFIDPYDFRMAGEAEVLATLRHLQTAGYAGIVFEFSWYDDKIAYFDTERESMSRYASVLERFLSAAKTTGMKVFVGLSYVPRMPDLSNAFDEAWLKEEANLNAALAREIYAKYAAYRDIFAGWYVPTQLYSLHQLQVDDVSPLWGNYLSTVKTALNAIDPALPLLICPTVYSANKSTQGTIQKQWELILEKAGLSETDIVAPLDYFSTANALYTEAVRIRSQNYLQGFYLACKGKTTLGAVLEIFADDSHTVTANRLIHQTESAKSLGATVLFTRYYYYALPNTLEELIYFNFLCDEAPYLPQENS